MKSFGFTIVDHWIIVGFQANFF